MKNVAFYGPSAQDDWITRLLLRDFGKAFPKVPIDHTNYEHFGQIPTDTYRCASDC